MNKIFFFGCYLFSVIAFATTESPIEEIQPISILTKSTQYKFEKPLHTTVTFEVPTYSFELKRDLNQIYNDRDVEKGTIEFEPNTLIMLGTNLEYDGYFLSLSLPLPESSDSIKEKGHTNFRDLRFSHSWKNFSFDVYYQKLSGFYSDSFKSKSSQEPSLIRSDLKSQNQGVSLFYVINPDKFTMASVFSSKSQKKGGSIVLMTRLNSFSIRGDSPFVPVEYQPLFGEGSSTYGVESNAFDVGAGYGYGWVTQRTYIGGQFLMSRGIQSQSVQSYEKTLSQNSSTEGLNLKFLLDQQRGNCNFGVKLALDSFATPLGNFTLDSKNMTISMYAGFYL